MSHPEFVNPTPFSAQALYLPDEENRPLCAVIVKATYDLAPAGTLSLAAQQRPLCLDGEPWGRPGVSSFRFEPEIAFTKLATDVVLLGHAHAPGRGTTQLDVELQVAALKKKVRVFGDRHFYKSFRGTAMTAPLPFETMPLRWERAFGGWNRSDANPELHHPHPWNSVGVGYAAAEAIPGEPIPLPNLEDPAQLISRLGDQPRPAGFGFVSPEWLPRARFIGTYDETWRTTRMPLLPIDFDRRFFNAAPADLICVTPLHGGERVTVTNASPNGHVTFTLPNEPPLSCTFTLRAGVSQRAPTKLDTVIVDLDENQLIELFRCHLPLVAGPEDLASIELMSS